MRLDSTPTVRTSALGRLRSGPLERDCAVGAGASQYGQPSGESPAAARAHPGQGTGVRWASKIMGRKE